MAPSKIQDGGAGGWPKRSARQRTRSVKCGPGVELQPLGDGPDFQLVAVRRAEVEDSVCGGLDMRGVAARGDEGRLREVGGVVVAATAFLLDVGEAGDLGGLVTADAGLGGPEREAAAAQVEMGKLLAAAPDMFVGFSGQAQPDAVEARVRR